MVIKGIVHEGEQVIRNYVAVSGGEMEEVSGELLPYMLHGTGDLFASGLTAAVYAGESLSASVEFACALVRHAMQITPDQPDYQVRGVSFESVLGDVTALLS